MTAASERAKKLKTHEEKVRSIKFIQSSSPLHRAAQQGHLTVCWLLLLSCYSTDEKDFTGNTPLHIAAAYGHVEIVSCFIEHGANLWIKNMFGMTALSVASENRCRQVLKEKMMDEENLLLIHEDSTLQEKKEKMRLNHIDKYASFKARIMDIIHGQRKLSCDQNDILELQNAIDEATKLGITTDVIELGKRRKQWLEMEQSLFSGIKMVQDNAPIVTSSLYTFVTNLQKKLTIVEQMTVSAKQDDLAVISLDSLLHSAHTLCKVSEQELHLQNTIISLESISYASSEDVQNIERLFQAINEAQNISEVLYECDAPLIEKASVLHSRLTSEVHLDEACKKMPQNVRLPVPEMSPKEAKEYWKDEDLGFIEETREYPLPPEETGEYIWIRSKSLEDLEFSIKCVERCLSEAENCNANDELMDKCKNMLKMKKDELKLLVKKDHQDHEAAVVEAQKLARKKKKKKKKK